MGPRLCKQSAEGSFIDVIKKGPVTLCKLPAAYIWPSQNGQIIFYSNFTCLERTKRLKWDNPLPGSPNKWRSQITEASQTCHRPSSSALIYKHCPRGFSAITNPTGMTIWMAVESGLLKKTEGGRQCCITPSRNRCRDVPLFIIDFQGQHLVVIVCLMSLWLVPCSLSTTGCQMEQSSTTLSRLGWHHAGIPTPPMEFPCGTDLFSFKILPGFFLKVFWVGEASKTSRGDLLSSPAAGRRPALFTWTTGIFRPYGCQCLCLGSGVSLWASKAKPLIGHGSWITQRNPFHPKSHPNS